MKVIFLVLILVGFRNYVQASDSKCQVRAEKLSICGQIEASTELTRKRSATLNLKLYENEKNLKLAKNVELKAARLWMQMGEHGHGSQPLEIKKMDDGYHIANAWFLMMGEWEIQMTLKRGESEEEVKEFICIGRKAKDSYIGKCK